MSMPSDWGTQIVDRALGIRRDCIQCKKLGKRCDRCKARKWETPERKRTILNLALSEKVEQCLYGHRNCVNISRHLNAHDHYTVFDAHAVWEWVDPKRLNLVTTREPKMTRKFISAMPGELGPVVQRQVVYSKPTYYENLADREARELIAYWIAEDRERKGYEWRFERDILQRTNEMGRFKGDGGIFNPHGLSTVRRSSRDAMDPVERERFINDPLREGEDRRTQPDYYILAHGYNPLTQKETVLIRVPSTSVKLMVDIPEHVEVVKGKSRYARRRARRNAQLGQGPTPAQKNMLDVVCRAAVARYWERSGTAA